MKKISISIPILLLLLLILSACKTTLSDPVDKVTGVNGERHTTNDSNMGQLKNDEVSLYDVIKKRFFKKKKTVAEKGHVSKQEMSQAVSRNSVTHQTQKRAIPTPVKTVTDQGNIVKREMGKTVASNTVQYQSQERAYPAPIKQRSVIVSKGDTVKGNNKGKDISVEAMSPGKLKQLLKDARRASKEQRYEDLLKITDTILKENPNDKSALAYKKIALIELEDRKHLAIMGQLEKLDAQERDKYFENLRERSIPYNDIMQFTKKDDWEDIKKRVQREEQNESLELGREHTERLQAVPSPSQNQISRVMKDGLNSKLSVEFIDTPLRDVVALLQEKTKLNFVLDEGTADRSVNLKLDNVDVRVILQYILPEGVDSVIKEDIVYITQEPLGLRVYDVRDLLINLEDRQDLSVQAPDVNSEEKSLADGENKDTFYRVQEIIDLIVHTVEPSSWVVNGGRGMIAAREGMLGDIVVTQASPIHKQIGDLLASLRSSSDLQVNIEARFIAVSDNFLESVGSNILDFDTSPERPSESNPKGIPGENDAGGVVSGFFTDTGNIFAGSAVASGANGLNLSYQIVEGFFLKGFLRAVQESDEAESLTSPNITLSNTQRGSIKVVTTFNYIESFRIVSQTPEPVIKEIDDGTTFNVRPIVSADRRYVYLEVHPVITRVTFDQIAFETVGPVSSGGAGGVPATNTIQLPITTKQELSVTVCVPDKGILMIGGLGSRKEIETSAGTPILSKIPLLKRLFSSNSIDRDIALTGNLIILIKPTVLIRDEEESRTFALGKPKAGYRPPTQWTDKEFRYPSK
ncbi:MAG: hypothetical protein D8M57_08445 [Candidatus Scalindua sp. AMX11]|nr:MAG: hypothetical protein DWQ00_05295 [Candidatus Scalindua sp.]NOG84369.1 hypothetical protein [Planctomycetota bacterium]RZV74450.1 MAG: hypothetical protein EX341_13175 [Candidatus Scalindua sp. SCAELEC01]TDE65372.1 MAG: hypothetical protein D8M57_08445 [Candidatus Scalindua sp. AMX11]GJQ60321.1 MAG: hypothetical protein SCALA701_31220 [Candidatus Scalindua sp.]